MAAFHLIIFSLLNSLKPIIALSFFINMIPIDP
jgi:hypothetical protein